ncbi:hypothetical protein HU200_061787 [Digitaria exilis]|uniref:Uncharacterized protein n=1 Tax=Digitaria exilis TaxID=1010633 RepID=A0A835A7P5_9POAL|nr:hypothetical protein HU200_061787 [Digitaria exilis]
MAVGGWIGELCVASLSLSLYPRAHRGLCNVAVAVGGSWCAAALPLVSGGGSWDAKWEMNWYSSGWQARVT